MVQYVTNFPDDDLMMPENLAAKVEVLSRNTEVGLIHSRYHVIDGEGRIIKFNTNKECAGERVCDAVEPGLNVLATLLGCNIIHESTVLFRKACYEKLGGFEDRFNCAFDWEYWMRIASSYDVAFIAKPLVKCRLHSGSITVVTSQRVREDGKMTIPALRGDLDGMRWILGRYLPSLSNKVELKRQMWRQMGARVADHAVALLGDDGPNPQVRSFLFDMCCAYPEILIEKSVWKAILKSLLSRDRILQLKRITLSK